MTKVERGYLLIADIGGYTRYLKAVELDHAHDVLADLIGVVADTIGATFTVDKLEGDAVFAHRSGNMSADQLVELVQATYFAFKRRQRDIAHNTSCSCRACTTAPELDLKFVIHTGEFVERKMARSRELVGADVVLVHRLLKNTVTKETGLRAYALFTQACVDHVEFDGTVALAHIGHGSRPLACTDGCANRTGWADCRRDLRLRGVRACSRRPNATVPVGRTRTRR